MARKPAWEVFPTPLATRAGKTTPFPFRNTSPPEGYEASLWPRAAEQIVRVVDYESGYAVDVELVRGSDGTLVPVGVAVRRGFPLEGGGTLFTFKPGAEPEPVSGRDARRLPLDRIIRAALVAASSDAEQRVEELSEILLPRGRPAGGERSRKFYREIADVYRAYQRQGLSPAKEIARRKGLPENTVHQWIYRARQLGDLEPPPRRPRRIT